SLGGSPPIVPRQAWGAVESMRRATPLYAPTIRIVIVHHTAGSNDYGPADSAAIVRGIYAYHVRANGWNDIGYNFLVDRYGQVFEGRYGGIDRNVVGAHAAGFNRGSVGIAVIGSYGSSSITPATREALARLISWRLDVAHVDPIGRTTFASGGNERFRAGKTLSLNVVSGHRDTGSTLCPGSRLYAQLPAIARKAASIGLPKLYAPVVSGKLGGEIRFSALLSGSLPWTVSISLGDTAVATGSGEGAKVDWAWDSRKVDASVAYRWTISAPGVRPASGLLPATAKPQPAPPPPPPPLQLLGGLSATPAVVTPNGDGVDDVLAVSYTLAEAATVTVFLVASDGTSTELAREDQQAGPQALQLDLSAVADGSYELRVVAQSATGEQAEASTPIGVDRVITSFSTDSPAFSPNGDRQRDAVVVDFGLAATARAELSVLRDGQSLGTLLAGNLSQGPQSFRWNGAVAGSRLEDGTYQLRLAVEGPTPAERTLEVRIDTTAPELAVTSWSPLELRLSEPAHVVAFVNGRRHELDVGAPSFVLPAQARVRTLSVTASDAAGNRISRRFR
ncbi:MAG: peptidoglycan recognition protein family protein, partial [Gaiellaceae bacterium]